VVLDGIAEVKLGGTVTRGQRLTCDSASKAVAAAPSAGVNNQIIGIALKSGVADDVIPVLLDKSTLQG
jgi:Na+-translocating ferredoxin:NAD+ oxidoreductase RnfC subunit